MDLGEQTHRVEFMISDRGSNFTASFDAVLAGSGIRIVLRRILREYEIHRNKHRPHGSLDETARSASAAQSPRDRGGPTPYSSSPGVASCCRKGQPMASAQNLAMSPGLEQSKVTFRCRRRSSRRSDRRRGDIVRPGYPMLTACDSINGAVGHFGWLD
jgi:hypothetical protein